MEKIKNRVDLFQYEDELTTRVNGSPSDVRGAVQQISFRVWRPAMMAIEHAAHDEIVAAVEDY